MQSDVIDYVRAQCENLSSQTRLIEERSQPFDSVDLTSLSQVKDFLHREQVSSLGSYFVFKRSRGNAVKAVYVLLKTTDKKIIINFRLL